MKNKSNSTKAVPMPTGIKIFVVCRGILCALYLMAAITSATSPMLTNSAMFTLPLAILELLCMIFIMLRKSYAKGWAIASTVLSAFWIVEIGWLIYLVTSIRAKVFFDVLRESEEDLRAQYLGLSGKNKESAQTKDANDDSDELQEKEP